MILARIILDGKPTHTGRFATWWDAYASALTRAQLRGARTVQVKPA